MLYYKTKYILILLSGCLLRLVYILESLYKIDNSRIAFLINAQAHDWYTVYL